jgi:hypothetical protein
MRTPTAGLVRVLTEKNIKYNMVLYPLSIKKVLILLENTMNWP